MTTLLSGKQVRDERREALAREVANLEAQPRLAIIQVGDREDSTAYIEQKKKFGETIGVAVEYYRYEVEIPEHRLIDEILRLNANDEIDGVIVQLPLPPQLNAFNVIESIDAAKDVDGLTAWNVKRLQQNDPAGFIPATARGIGTLLSSYEVPVEGKHAVVVGRSQLVGTPTAHLLLNRGATVTVCHKQTGDLAPHTTTADILVVATGNAHLIGPRHVHEEQTVVDVGINTLEGTPLQEELPGKKFTGDVDFEAVKERVAAITPVPGGVGPLTVLSLFENVLDAYRRQKREQYRE